MFNILVLKNKIIINENGIKTATETIYFQFDRVMYPFIILPNKFLLRCNIESKDEGEDDFLLEIRLLHLF